MEGLLVLLFLYLFGQAIFIGVGFAFCIVAGAWNAITGGNTPEEDVQLDRPE